MDILKILNESSDKIYLEDLDFFEAELATGKEYSVEYQNECLKKIKNLREWLNGDSKKEKNKKKNNKKENDVDSAYRVMVNFDDLMSTGNQKNASLTKEQIIFSKIYDMRQVKDYKTLFKKYVRKENDINAEFIDTNYSFFEPWEINTIVSIKQLPEEFLEKYFGAIDHDKIARYQIFSEEFFMKHFAQMNVEAVLKHSKNEWKEKEKRSKQLDVYLRLKGVRI